MTIKEKILTFLDARGIKKTEFFEAAGLSPSNFKGAAKQGELGGDKIAKILTMYPELSAEWLMRDSGPMLLEAVNIETRAPEIAPIPECEESPSSTDAAFIVDKLLNRLDDANAIARTISEENGRLKGQIEILKEQLREARVFPPADTTQHAAPSRAVLQET